MPEYHSLVDFDGPRAGNKDGHPLMSGRNPQRSRSRLASVVLQLLGLLWTVPIVTLLVLNFRQHIIGASAWCPGNTCWVDAFDMDTRIPQQNMRKFDKDNHNLLGALQIVSKALEVWFSFVAARLVYAVTMMIAAKPHGLPIGYLYRPTEFSDVLSLFDRTLWTSLPWKSSPSQKHTHFRYRVWLFVLMTVVLCIISNLMGPATAVLVLPSLQWLDTKSIGIGTFDRFNSDAPPDPRGFFAVNQTGYCEEYDTDYSCLADYWAVSLDALITASIDGYSRTSQQGSLTFGFNGTSEVSSDKTTSDFTYWAPNRQTLHDLEMDFSAVGEISYNVPANESDLPAAIYDSYVPYNKSLQTQLQRSGPIVGCLPNMWLGSPWHDLNVTVVDSDRSIRCYEGYDISNTPGQEGTATGNYTKCIRTGTGWNQANKQAGFTVSGPTNGANQTDPGVVVDLYFSDAAAFFPPGLPPAWLNEGCLINGTVAQGLACDWDRFFSTEGEGSMTNRSSSVNTIEMTMMASNHSTAVMVMVDYVAFLNFTTYALDPSPSTNPLFLVQNPQLPSTGSPLVIDPSWTLVAWSAANGSYLSPNRSATLTLLNVMSNALTDPEELYDDPLLDDISLLPVVQTLSLIDFSYANSSAPFSHDPLHPVLHRNARLYVWAFGITSRTAILGTIVTTLGIFVVLTQFILGLAYPKMKRHLSPTELLVAALRHVPQGEFNNIGDEETELAKVRFQGWRR